MNKGQRRYKIFGFTKRTVAILTTVVIVALVFLPTSSVANSDRWGGVFPEEYIPVIESDSLPDTASEPTPDAPEQDGTPGFTTDPVQQSDTPDVQDGTAGLTTEPQELSALGEPDPDPEDIPSLLSQPPKNSNSKSPPPQADWAFPSRQAVIWAARTAIHMPGTLTGAMVRKP